MGRAWRAWAARIEVLASSLPPTLTLTPTLTPTPTLSPTLTLTPTPNPNPNQAKQGRIWPLDLMGRVRAEAEPEEEYEYEEYYEK